jgi:hypothetical protein
VKEKIDYQSKYFSIDAICIDQQNVKERNHQVQQMSAIYSTATEVIAWLGHYPEVIPTPHFSGHYFTVLLTCAITARDLLL